MNLRNRLVCIWKILRGAVLVHVRLDSEVHYNIDKKERKTMSPSCMVSIIAAV